MLLDKDKLSLLLSDISLNYKKTLLVNMDDCTYQEVSVPDDEMEFVSSHSSKSLKEYWFWFCNSDLVHTEDKPKCLEFTEKITCTNHIVYRRRMENNEWHWVLLSLVPSASFKKLGNYWVLYVIDIDEIYTDEYESVVEKIGTTDKMTGLYNRFAFERDYEKYKEEKVGIAYCDLNGLKYANDNFGHKAGDNLILTFAGLLSVNFNDYKCYHISGDEFIVCAFNPSLHSFIKRCVAFHKSVWLGAESPMASIGYSIGEPGEFDKALEEAEKEMYDDKRIFYLRYPEYKRN